MITRSLLFLLSCVWATNLIGSPAEDLGSPFQQTRDAAATVLRTNYVAPSRTNWEAVVTSITTGMTKTNLLKLLSPYHMAPLMGMAGGGSYSETYRLDGAWALTCWFRNQGDVLIDRELSPSVRNVWVAPSTNFSGIWITYFVNGQKSHEIHYDNGKYHGEFIAYSPAGSKLYVQHYNHQVGDGEDTGYFASGRTNYHGIYQRDKQVGIWTWYNEDGSVKSTKDYSK